MILYVLGAAIIIIFFSVVYLSHIHKRDERSKSLFKNAHEIVKKNGHLGVVDKDSTQYTWENHIFKISFTKHYTNSEKIRLEKAYLTIYFNNDIVFHGIQEAPIGMFGNIRNATIKEGNWSDILHHTASQV